MSESPARLPRAVLWDLDGTLADSRDQHWRAWRDAMAAAGRTLTAEQFAATFGQRNDRFLRSWLGDDQSPTEQLARFGDEKEARYRRLIEAEGLEPLPGAASWVRRLNAAGWRQAVASSAPRQNIEAMLRAIGLDTICSTCSSAPRTWRTESRTRRSFSQPQPGSPSAIPLHRRRGRGGRDRGREARRHGARLAWALVPASLRMLSCRRWPI